MTRVLVCGGRDYQDRRRLGKVLDAAIVRLDLSTIITDGQTGAAWLARAWAERKKIPAERFKTNWGKEGKAAGHNTNERMIAEGKPDLVIAFPGERLTTNLVKQAEAAGLPVHKIDWPDQPDQFPDEPDPTGQMELRI